MVNLVDLKKLIERFWEDCRKQNFDVPEGHSVPLQFGSLGRCDECKETTPGEYLEDFFGRTLCFVCLSQVKRECSRCGKEIAYWYGEDKSNGFVCTDCLTRSGED